MMMFRPGDLLGYIGTEECYKGMTCRVISQVPETNSVQVQWLVPNSRRAPKAVLPNSVFNLLQSAPKKQPSEIKERDFGSFGFRGNSLTEFLDGCE